MKQVTFSIVSSYPVKSVHWKQVDGAATLLFNPSDGLTTNVTSNNPQRGIYHITCNICTDTAVLIIQ